MRRGWMRLGEDWFSCTARRSLYQMNVKRNRPPLPQEGNFALPFARDWPVLLSYDAPKQFPSWEGSGVGFLIAEAECRL
jgi:hypothetical protein